MATRAVLTYVKTFYNNKMIIINQCCSKGLMTRGQGQGLKCVCKLNNSWYFICHKNKNNMRTVKHQHKLEVDIGIQ